MKELLAKLTVVMAIMGVLSIIGMVITVHSVPHDADLRGDIIIKLTAILGLAIAYFFSIFTPSGQGFFHTILYIIVGNYLILNIFTIPATYGVPYPYETREAIEKEVPNGTFLTGDAYRQYLYDTKLPPPPSYLFMPYVLKMMDSDLRR